MIGSGPRQWRLPVCPRPAIARTSRSVVIHLWLGAQRRGTPFDIVFRGLQENLEYTNRFGADFVRVVSPPAVFVDQVAHVLSQAVVRPAVRVALVPPIANRLGCKIRTVVGAEVIGHASTDK